MWQKGSQYVRDRISPPIERPEGRRCSFHRVRRLPPHCDRADQHPRPQANPAEAAE